MSIASQKQALIAFEGIASKADLLARRHGKTAEVKLPILTNHLSLVIRNIDENNRDEPGSINSIQVAMDIAVLASEQGMVSSCYKSQGSLRLQISTPQPETHEKAKNTLLQSAKQFLKRLHV